MLINKLRRTSKKSLRALMGISEDLANLNKDRYENFEIDAHNREFKAFHPCIQRGCLPWIESRGFF